MSLCDCVSLLVQELCSLIMWVDLILKFQSSKGRITFKSAILILMYNNSYITAELPRVFAPHFYFDRSFFHSKVIS